MLVILRLWVCRAFLIKVERLKIIRKMSNCICAKILILIIIYITKLKKQNAQQEAMINHSNNYRSEDHNIHQKSCFQNRIFTIDNLINDIKV